MLQTRCSIICFREKKHIINLLKCWKFSNNMNVKSFSFPCCGSLTAVFSAVLTEANAIKLDPAVSNLKWSVLKANTKGHHNQWLAIIFSMEQIYDSLTKQISESKALNIFLVEQMSDPIPCTSNVGLFFTTPGVFLLLRLGLCTCSFEKKNLILIKW